MPNQTSLPDVESPPQPTDRIFFAIVPDSAAIARVQQLTDALRRKYVLRGAPIDAMHLHVTLLLLGNYVGFPHRKVHIAAQAAAHVAQAPFRVGFDQVQTFRNRSRTSGQYPTVLYGGDGTIGVEALFQRLVDTLHQFGFEHLPANITPHMTLLYDREKIIAQEVAPIEWDVSEFVLLHREIGKRREYRELGRWPLRNRR